MANYILIYSLHIFISFFQHLTTYQLLPCISFLDFLFNTSWMRVVLQSSVIIDRKLHWTTQFLSIRKPICSIYYLLSWSRWIWSNRKSLEISENGRKSRKPDSQAEIKWTVYDSSHNHVILCMACRRICVPNFLC